MLSVKGIRHQTIETVPRDKEKRSSRRISDKTLGGEGTKREYIFRFVGLHVLWKRKHDARGTVPRIKGIRCIT